MSVTRKRHADDEPVIFGHAASSNISFRGERDSGITWGEWREMSPAEQGEAIQDHVNMLVDVRVKEDES